MGKINADAIRFAPNGRILMANANTVMPTIPTDPATAFDDSTAISGWTDLGYASDDGVELTPSLNTTEVNVWQSASAAKINVVGAGLDIKFTLMQWDADATAMFFGATWGAKDETTGLSTMRLPSNPVLRERALLVLWGDADNVHGLYVPRAMVNDRDGLVVGKTNPQGLGMTLRSLDSAGMLADLISTADMTSGGSGS